MRGIIDCPKLAVAGVAPGVSRSAAAHQPTGKRANLAKAAGININLWMGIAMLVLGVLFLVWWRLNPIRHEQQDQSPRETSAGQ
jgi:hypothetical protein